MRSSPWLISTCMLTTLVALGASRTPAPKTAVEPLIVIAAPPPATRPTTVPSISDQSRAEKDIKEVYRKEYALRHFSDRQALARRLLQQARETRDDPAARYVLLRESRDLAAGAGDAPTAAAAIDQLSRLYTVDALTLSVAAMPIALRTAPTTQAIADVARLSLPLVDRAVLVDDYDSASRLCTLAQTAAEKAGHTALISACRLRFRELQATFLEYRAIAPARAVLRDRPAESIANGRVGRFLCFTKNDWTAGLPHLGSGSDTALAEVARRDLSAPSDPAARMQLGDSWWDIADTQSGIARKHIHARAAHWYRQALPALTGLHRTVAAKRIETADLEALQGNNIQPGLLAELHKGIDFDRCVKTRIDPQIDFNWGEEAPDPALTKDNFSIRWTGLIRPPAAGRYELVILANLGARIWIDDRQILDAPNLSRTRNGARLFVQFDAAPHAIRIDYWDTSGLARMRLLWRPPGAAKEEPVPPSAFFHDAFAPTSALQP